MDVIQEAEIWLIDNGILPLSIDYNIYKKKRLLYHYQDAVAVAGIGKDRDGNSIGFAIEVAKGQGVVRGGILEPYGIATWGRQATLLAMQYDKPIVDVFQEMARDHRMFVQTRNESQEPTQTNKTQETPKPKQQPTETDKPQPKSFVLPFKLKKTLDYKPTIGVRGNQSTNSYIKLIRVIATGYFKSLLQDEEDFYESRFDNPALAFDDERVIANADVIGKFIHDFVWHIVSENTPISGNHRLLYGSKYTPLLVEIADGFYKDSDKTVSGIQRYVESLMDYYINIVISGEPIATHTRTEQETPTTHQPPTTETENDEKKEQEKASWLTIIGVCFMGFITLGGVIKDYFGKSSKETVTSQAPELVEQPLPSTGDTDNPNFYGDNPLTIKTKYGKNYWIKISNATDDRAMASYFIRGGETLYVKVPKGSYTIKYASGDKWYGTVDLFGEKTQYAKADEVFTFRNNNGYTIELIYQANGNLHTKGLKANQF